ncbi:CatB-related O-acetyltransferase [Mesoflavibacter sp. CH_XMU1422-2]|uniref:CatB-related O-acetyltransferase n=1 Tax=Mesoflavibacter sp. CH_XMU1422-2 TaxID=3107770 RepID=UPI00300A489E
MQIGLLINKIFKKTYKMFSHNTFTKKEKIISIKSILLICDNDNEIDLDFNNALNIISEDYDIQKYSLKDIKKNKINIGLFDFIIYFMSDTRISLRFFRKIKIKKGIYINKILSETKLNQLKYFDLIWASSYSILNKIKINKPKLHAFGVDFESNESVYLNDERKSILWKRFHNIDLNEAELTKKNQEFKDSPIWDIKYFSIQLRKGLQFFQKDIDRRTNFIESSHKLKAGRNSFYNKNLLITGDEFVEIGSFCSFGKNISVYTSNHDTKYATTQGYLYRKYFNKNHPGEEKKSKERTKGPVIIKNDVWIGDGVKIMSGVTIGNGACIGAGAVVTKNIGDYEIFAGIPAKRVGYRFSANIIEQLLEVKWWCWSDSKIERNIKFFETDLNTVDNIKLLIEE